MTDKSIVRSNLEYVLYSLILVENNLKDTSPQVFSYTKNLKNSYYPLEPVNLKKNNRALDEIIIELKDLEKDIDSLNLTNGIDYDTYLLNIFLESFNNISFNKSMGLQAFNNNLKMVELLRAYLESLYYKLS